MVSRPKSTEIRQFIIDNVEEHPTDIARLVADHFAITRQAVRRHLLTLIDDEILQAEGETRRRRYQLKVYEYRSNLTISENPDEDKVWRNLIEPVLRGNSENVMRICYYGFTEMFNNALDHSEGEKIIVVITLSARSICLSIRDNGIGIFEKIKVAFGLEDYRHAILELSKGKLTTDPSRHSGQGIFFTSRAFDQFVIISGHFVFTHNFAGDFFIEGEATEESGTYVKMEINPDSRLTLREVFDRYTDLAHGDFPFSKTHVPLSLARYGDDQLVSRSQAKRVLARFDRFEEVMLDFAGIDEIGQGFADEIFRVFRNANPQIKLLQINANDAVSRMIRRAENWRDGPRDPPLYHD